MSPLPSPWCTRREAAEYLRWSVDSVDRALTPMDEPASGKMRYQLQLTETRRVRIWSEDVLAICPMPQAQEAA